MQGLQIVQYQANKISREALITTRRWYEREEGRDETQVNNISQQYQIDTTIPDERSYFETSTTTGGTRDEERDNARRTNRQ